MATLGAASIVYSDATRLLHDSQQQPQPRAQEQIGWCSPEADAVRKAVEQPEDDEESSSDHDTLSWPPSGRPANSANANAVPVRGARSQSLTDPTTQPIFVPEDGTVTPSPSLSVPERHQADKDAAAVAPLANPAPLVTPHQLATDPRFARRNRRSMSAEFTLSMLQQELGYPTRKASRRDSIERKSRRASSVIVEEELNNSSGDDDSALLPPSSSSHIASAHSARSCSGDEPEPERRSSMARRHSVESATAPGAQYRSSGSDCGARKRRSYDDATATTADDVSDDDEGVDDRNQDKDQDEEDDDYNFMDTRVASVTGFSQDTDGVVYYEIIVRSVAHGPLSAYKVRRRYSEFRELHRALATVMTASRKAPQLTELTNPLHSDDATASTSTALAALGREPLLPPLPDRGGLWAYLQFDTTPFLERRAKYFEALLVACQHHARARATRLLNEFLGSPPDAVALNTSVENSYVSLNRFAAPKLRLSVEAHERKQKARNISRRRSSVHRAATACS